MGAYCGCGRPPSRYYRTLVRAAIARAVDRLTRAGLYPVALVQAVRGRHTGPQSGQDGPVSLATSEPVSPTCSEYHGERYKLDGPVSPTVYRTTSGLSGPGLEPNRV